MLLALLPFSLYTRATLVNASLLLSVARFTGRPVLLPLLLALLPLSRAAVGDDGDGSGDNWGVRAALSGTAVPGTATNDTQSLVPTATCHNIANQHLCYQGPAATIANVLRLDPFSCKPPKDSTVVNGTCAAAGYTDYKLNDPVFREAELWCKAGKHCLL